MDHFCGTERFKYTGVCVVDSMGFGSSKVASEPDAHIHGCRGDITMMLAET